MCDVVVSIGTTCTPVWDMPAEDMRILLNIYSPTVKPTTKNLYFPTLASTGSYISTNLGYLGSFKIGSYFLKKRYIVAKSVN